MGVMSIDTTSEHVTLDGFDGRYGTVDDVTVGFESYTLDNDPAALFAGLPEDACQCPHWGVVLEGSLVFRYPDGRRDVVHAGQAYYAPPGHLPEFRAGSRIVEFSPTAALEQTMTVVLANLAATGAG